MKRKSRRRFLSVGGGVAAAALLPALLARDARAQMMRTPLNNMAEKIRALVGNAVVHRGRVKLEIPPLVENGHLVPLVVQVESPMTAADHVQAIHVFTERNPLPEMVSYRLGPRAGRAYVATRVRMADTQNVVAIAHLSDGSYWSDSAHLIVTIAACLEELPA